MTTKQLYFVFVTVFFLGVVAGMAALSFFTVQKNISPIGGGNGGAIACPAMARLCPDGSSVGATGPNCEFVCPNGNAPGNYPTTSENPPSTVNADSVGIECPPGYYPSMAIPEDGWQCVQDVTSHIL
jgi:hypothetical protein